MKGCIYWLKASWEQNINYYVPDICVIQEKLLPLHTDFII